MKKVGSLRIEARQKLKPTDRFLSDRHPGFPAFHRQTYRYCLYIWNSTEKADNKSDKEKIMAYDLSVLDQGCRNGHCPERGTEAAVCGFYEYLVEKNKVMNLTGITEFQEVLVKHFLDSLACVKAVDIKK